jgi:hypothetical protein
VKITDPPPCFSCERGGAAAFGLDLGDQAGELGFAAGADDDLRTFRREKFGRGPADTGAGAGDDRHFVR